MTGCVLDDVIRCGDDVTGSVRDNFTKCVWG